MIAILAMLAGLAYGVYMFFAFVFCVLSHEDPRQEELQKWLESLTPAERKAYLHHKKRQREYATFIQKRRKACPAIAQRMYDAGVDYPLETDVWHEAGEQVGRAEGWRPGIGLFSSYEDVWGNPDWTSTVGGIEPMYKRLDAHEDAPMDINRWRDKPKRPSWA
jgi:hypothetical protein